MPATGSQAFRNHFKNLWAIKHPALRAIRLKMCYKDIYSNERRHRFGIADSPNCLRCGQIESVDHQMFECENAQRLWNVFRTVTGTSVASYRDVVQCEGNYGSEILKSAIIKALIQIHRSSNLPERVVARECAYFLRIEAAVNPTNEAALLSLVTKLNNIP